MFKPAEQDTTRTYIGGEGQPDFNKIDPRIKQVSRWTERYPGGCSISFPTKDAKEIISKLMVYQGITSVGSEKTAYGIEIENSFKP